jgi:hypothetical protein
MSCFHSLLPLSLLLPCPASNFNFPLQHTSTSPRHPPVNFLPQIPPPFSLPITLPPHCTRIYYVISKNSVFNIIWKASRCKGNTNNNFVSLLEKKLSAIPYRSGLAPTTCMLIVGIIVEVLVGVSRHVIDSWRKLSQKFVELLAVGELTKTVSGLATCKLTKIRRWPPALILSSPAMFSS